MSKRQKRLARIRQNPQNVSLDDLRRVLEDYGFEYKQTVGSHYTFSVVIGERTKLLVVPFRRPIKAVYVKKALKMIDEIIELEGAPDEPDDDN